jgi:prevent-host-death family protein
MKKTLSAWSAAEAKAALSRVIDDAGIKPQVIERHGKPVAAVVGWKQFSRCRGELEGGMAPWLGELAEINREEGDMDAVVRSDRHLPEGLGTE